MAGEIIYAADEGVQGGSADDTADFHALLAAAPTGAEIVLGPNRYNIKSGVTCDKPLTIRGCGPRSEIYWNPDTAGDTLLRFQSTGAATADKNEEGQLYGPRLQNLRILGKREKLAHALHLYRCDNYHIDNVFVEGIAGASLYMDRTREGVVNAFRSRFCGNQTSQVPDINIVSIEGSADTSNYQMWSNIFSVFSHWHGLHLDNADKITIQNLMVHQYPATGTTEFLANFHAFSANRFGTDLFQAWLDSFNTTITGGIWTHAINAINGSSLNVDGIQCVGGTPHKVILSDASNVHLQNGWVVGADSTDGCLMFADNVGFLTWNNLFVDGANQVYGSANGGACAGLSRLGPAFSAVQDFSSGGVIEDSFGGALRLKRDLDLRKSLVFSPNVHASMSKTGGTKIGTAEDQLLSLWGATPGPRPNISGSRSGNAALASLLAQGAARGFWNDGTTA